MPRRTLTLFGTEGCHLCDAAEALFLRTADGGESLLWGLQRIEIAGDAQLEQRYGVRIPVLRSDDGAELGWPFDEDALRHWLEDLQG